MRVSIFTPTHDSKYLAEAWESIKDQPFDEWLILHNNGSLPIGIGDERVREEVAAPAPKYVGAMKAQACALCTGDILLELDHDDLLLPGAVDKVRAAFLKHRHAALVYSNALRVQMNAERLYEAAAPFAEGYGWVTRPATHRMAGGYELVETVSFPPDPASVSRVWFAPDHLKAYRASAYRAVGGYDPGMRVLDDQDLMARLYAEGEFVHLDEPLYIYRIHGENAWLANNAEIQQGVMPLYDRHIERIVQAWARRNRLRCLDLGGRFGSPDGYETVDVSGADVTCDLDEPWPFGANSVGLIRAYDVLEHLRDPINTMRECYRVLAPGGWIICQVPLDGRAWRIPRPDASQLLERELFSLLHA